MRTNKFKPDTTIALTTDENCKGLPQDERVKALGFELGSCLFEADIAAKGMGLEIRGEEGPHNPEHIYTFLLRDYAGNYGLAKPKEKFTIFMFDQDQLLFAVKAVYVYKRGFDVYTKDYNDAKAAFATLDKVVADNYGEGKIESFSKTWERENVSVQLRFDVDTKSSSTISLSYFLNSLWAKAKEVPSK